MRLRIRRVLFPLTTFGMSMLQPIPLTMTNRYLSVWTESLALLADTNSIVLGLALLAVVILLAVSFWVGRKLGRREALTEQFADTDEKQRMLDLVQEIGSWTHEYSGTLSQYQSELDELNREVAQQSLAITSEGTSEATDSTATPLPSGGNDTGSRPNEGSSEGPNFGQTNRRIVSLLQQFMQDNGTLQQRLDTAEMQLEQKTRQIQRYLNQARTDGLTGLLNRRAFDQYLDELFSNHRRGGRSFVIALIDVDHFKRVNDNHGHQTGDGTLRHIAQQLQSSLSEALMVARFGGEEFAVILDGPLQHSAKLIDRVRQDIGLSGQKIDGLQLHCTISAGLSEPHDDTSAAALLRRADEALYGAKNFGRNRVYFHDGLEPTLVGAPETAQS